ASILNRPLLVRAHLTAEGVDDRRQTRFGIDVERASRSRAAAPPAASTTAGTRHARRDAAEPDVRRIATEQRRERWSNQRHGAARLLEAERVVVGGVRARAAERMTLRETHWPLCRGSARRCAHELGELHRELHALWRAQS